MRIATFLKQNAQQCILFLREQGAIDPQYSFFSDDTHIFVVVIKEPLFEGISYEENTTIQFTEYSKTQSLRDALQGKIPNLDQLKTSFDVVGKIAILEIDDEFRSFENLIGETLLCINPSIQTVLRKDGPHQGEFRTQPMKCIGGVDTRETTHVENGISLTVDVEQVYFSPRLSNERLRIATEVTNGESILHCFSGCAPLECVIGSKKNVVQVGVEKNPLGHSYGLKNVTQNKISQTQLVCKDFSEFDTQQKFDRIVMNLPKNAIEYVPHALLFATPKCVMHIYDFAKEGEFDSSFAKISELVTKSGKKCELLGYHTCGVQGVRLYRVCIDVKIISQK